MSDHDKATSPGDTEKLSNLRVILGDHVPTKRLCEILSASSGSVERAVEIYFHQQDIASSGKSSRNEPARRQQQFTQSLPASKSTSTTTSPAAQTGKKRSPASISAPAKTPKKYTPKQAKLDSFLGIQKSSTPSSQPRQARLDSFFGPAKSPSSPTKLTANTTKIIKSKTEVVDLSSSPTNTPKTESRTAYSPISTRQSSVQAPKEAIPEGKDMTTTTVSFERFADLLQQMADTTKRTIKLNALETFIREIMDEQQDDLATRAQVLTSALELVLGGKTSKPLNISDSAVSKALQLSLGVSRSQMSKAYRQHGDIGDVAASFFQKKTFFVTSGASRHLSIVQVSQALEKICVTDGRDAKQHIALGLLRKCQTKTEIRFMARLLIRFMRIGANLKTILAALSMAVVSKSKESSKDDTNVMDVNDAIALVQKTHDICPNIGKIVHALLEGGFEQMKKDCSIEIHTCIAPMLAHPIHSMDEVETAMNKEGYTSAIMEYKYDGMRLQAHFDGNSVKLFSRHMLETTSQFPEVTGYLKDAFCVKDAGDASFIIDAEVVGVEGSGDGMNLLPFQELATRRKKNDDGKGVQVKIFAFDLMLLGGVSLINEPLHNRRKRLFEHFKETANFQYVTSEEITRFDESRVLQFLKESVEHGAEGIMMKLIGTDTRYEAGTRSHSWLKVKRDYVAGFADTIDVVPIGAWYGNGRKAQKSFLSPVLLAVYDDQEDVYRSVSRCMTFTDEMYTNMREFYFRNTPYPEETEGKTGEVAVILEKENDEGDVDSDAGDDEVLGDGDDATDTKDEDGDRVNCFSSRPSSTVVVTNESPSIWFKPMEVFEVSFADLSLSRQHTAAAGMVDEDGRGIALRFPRFKRRRPDKKPEQATTSIQMAQLFSKQTKISRGSGTKLNP